MCEVILSAFHWVVLVITVILALTGIDIFYDWSTGGAK